MEELGVSHNAGLIAMSLVVALVAGFTGLSLTRDLSKRPLEQRKLLVSLAAIALGGGIWSMHFVAMLGLQLPILFYYDAAITLASALIAILIVGGALILLHFTQRTPGVILGAGALIGAGILVMHYVGMAGLELCRAVYTLPGLVLSSVVAVALCMGAIWLAYSRRTNRSILLGTLGFGLAVFSVHFLAMAGTSFVADPGTEALGPIMSNEVLAIGVILSSFVIFGAFLWVSTTYLEPPAPTVEPEEALPPPPTEAPKAPAPAEEAPQVLRIPCEREGGKVFVAPQDVAFVRADGHYTQVYTEADRLFCVWPITEASRRLLPAGFVKSHRSYLINPGKVARFERTKDKGQCTFTAEDLPPAPVSRANLKEIQARLAPLPGATRAG